MYDGKVLCSTVDDALPLKTVVPSFGRRMTPEQDVLLVERNGDDRIRIVEAFDNSNRPKQH
jgi:hypothetical protein